MRESLRKLERDQEDRRTANVKKQAGLEGQKEQKSRFEQELDERRVILKYLDLPESKLFDTGTVLQESSKKLKETAELKRSLEKEEDSLQKEYVQLTQGKVLELSSELEQKFSSLGIHTVYGMEWLKKNGYPEEKNKALVRANPFLPYALILSRREISMLEEQAGKLYTSSPVPVIARENLEDICESSGGPLISYDVKGRPAVSFYILFNENLLNEEKLAELVREKEEQIRRKKEAVRIRDQEYREYFARQEKIRNQKVTEENWKKACETIKELETEIAREEQAIRKCAEELSGLKSELDSTEKELVRLEQEINGQQRRMEDLCSLCGEYEKYEQCRKELEGCRKQEQKVKNRQKLSGDILEKTRETLYTLGLEKSELERTKAELARSTRKYGRYDSSESDMPVDVEKLEARYEAVTAGVTQELRELEEQEQRAAGRYAKAREELDDLSRKFHLTAPEWEEVSYNKKEEAHQEVLLEERNIQIERKRTLWNEEDKEIAVTDSRIRECRERMRRECGEDEPLSGGEIQNRDFDARKNQLRYEEANWEKEGKRLQEALRSCDENLTALSEFGGLPLRKPVEWEEDPSVMTAERLRKAKGILVRDYNQCKQRLQECRERLAAVLNRVVRMDIFQDDFYKKPLEAMLELNGSASLVLEQLDTTVRSYDSLMEKLEVDISLVEKEKERVVELLEEYVREVHGNLGKIDHNSTIAVRGKPVKMLKITIPEWEDNANLYRIRLQDMLDEVTRKGVDVLERGENVQEYIGIQITTKNLYNTVIGIGNVQIRLYKIEEYREYPITWAEVAKNSGGEGFLSAFVILSSLLCYMRKDDTDIFAEKNEGKVLLMDNPFAQTNAAHLLKPLMDMAAKTNTQLICLSGLGGESIYNRFDNIYILNLIAASLRNGMQYLKADHLRGNEPETVIASRIEVAEQQELIF